MPDLELYGRQRTCADQLNDTIFCQRPPGHAGSHQHKWSANDPVAMWGEREIDLQGTFRVERRFTYDDPDFAARMRVLPDYTVSILNPNITGVMLPGHE